MLYFNERFSKTTKNRKDSELNKEISLKLSKLSVVKDGKELTLVADIDPFVATSRDYNELQWFWEEWFNGASKSLKDIYEESVALLDASIKERGLLETKKCSCLRNLNKININFFLLIILSLFVSKPTFSLTIIENLRFF